MVLLNSDRHRHCLEVSIEETDKECRAIVFQLLNNLLISDLGPFSSQKWPPPLRIIKNILWLCIFFVPKVTQQKTNTDIYYSWISNCIPNMIPICERQLHDIPCEHCFRMTIRGKEDEEEMATQTRCLFFKFFISSPSQECPVQTARYFFKLLTPKIGDCGEWRGILWYNRRI